MRAILTGGGTGGHIYPALAIADGLKEHYPGAELLYIGNSRGMEVDIVRKKGIILETIPLSGLERRWSLKNFRSVCEAAGGIFSAIKIIKRFKPDIVIGTGGYVCGPVVLAAALKGIPTLIHEQNAYPGITNKLLSRFVDMIAVTFGESIKLFPGKAKIKTTGLPIRPEILRLADNSVLSDSEIKIACPDSKGENEKSEKPVILSFGGSLGAASINKAMSYVINKEIENNRFQLCHVTGRGDYSSFVEQFSNYQHDGVFYGEQKDIRIEKYIYDMGSAMKSADLVICRAGAATLAEITVLGLPAILIPFPYAAENHQQYNAQALADKGAAVIIKDSELNGPELYSLICELINDREKLTAMQNNSLTMGKPQALNDILKMIEEVLAK